MQWERQRGLGIPDQEGNQDHGPGEECFPESKSPQKGISFTAECLQMRECVCERGRGGQRGEKQAVTPSTTLESLFSTRPLYLVANISPGKRKHFSGQSLRELCSPPPRDLCRGCWGHPGVLWGT